MSNSQNANNSRPVPENTVTLDKFSTFIEYFCAPKTTPVFFDGTSSQAIRQGFQERKAVLFYLHCDEHQKTDEFCLDVLCNDNFRSFVNQNFVLWGGCVSRTARVKPTTSFFSFFAKRLRNTNSEANHLSFDLNASSFPFLALIEPSQTKPTILATYVGPYEPNTLMYSIRKTIEKRQAKNLRQHEMRAHLDENVLIREEQDREYEESLRRDREREERERAERERQEAEERAAHDVQREIEEREMERETARQVLINVSRTSVPVEPAPSDAGIVRVIFKFPSGERKQRLFRQTESVRDVLNYVQGEGLLLTEHRICTQFPRKVLHSPNSSEITDGAGQMKLDQFDRSGQVLVIEKMEKED
ncbi:putative FAS-associated factor 1 [Blattamonas nauphoetae]|uniref:FAS-associated factor 1 n=1 Tax=Blattamonas nauphoetae TaxID=2049346 RepID=A0ABQ9XJ02_9EUKA|nr:putative FAS-associated factor 1 [Blattamonas nauphoetae]